MISHWEFDVLAGKLVGIDENTACESPEQVEEKIYEKYNIDMEDFAKIAKDLLCLTNPVESALTGELSQAFIEIHDSGYCTAIIQQPFNKGER